MTFPYIIAEIGINHNGSYDLAKQHIDLAFKTRCSAVKFQTFQISKLLHGTVAPAQYQKSASFSSQNDMLSTCILSKEELIDLKNYSSSLPIDFLSTAYDFDDAKLLSEIGCRSVKLASISFVETALVEYCLSLFDHVYLSTGFTQTQELKHFSSLFAPFASKLKIFHCISSYPCSILDSSLHYIDSLRSLFPDIEIGFSDHCTSHLPSVIAAGMGVLLFEKHITIDRSLPGPDHAMSLGPTDLKSYVNSIHDVVSLKSNQLPFRTLSTDEKLNIVPMRRTLRAFTDIKPGEQLSHSNLVYTRPSSPVDQSSIRLGMISHLHIPKGSVLTPSMFNV